MPNLLLIDDDEAYRKMLFESLKHAGHSVTEACDGRQGLALYKAGSHALIITDLIMPEKEGFEIIMELRKQNPAVKIIAMSGGVRYAADTYLSAAKALGASRVFAKPFPVERLLAAVNELTAA